jgi:hypothetical protein
MLVINRIPFNLVVVSPRLEFAKESTCVVAAPHGSGARSIKHLVTFCIILDFWISRFASQRMR